MLPLRTAHKCLGRGFALSLLQTGTRRLYSTTRASPGSTGTKTKGYIAIATVTSAASYLWWSNTGGDEVPSLDSSSHVPPHAGRGLSQSEVTSIISQGAYSLPVKTVPGVDRYDGAQVASNSPCEDRFIHGQFPSPWDDGNQWMAWAVFDGHAGWQTADLLEKQLLPAVRRSLSQAPSTDEAVQGAIMKAFVDLDDSLVKTALDTTQSTESLQDKVSKLTPAFAGSCALLALYNPATSTLYVACTGDSRAVLGQGRADGTWEATPLSVDQTGSNTDEIARISMEHPGEEGIAKDGRILGLMVSRAFGDGRWKWPLELQRDLKERFGGQSPLTPRYDVRTPPYLTAEPVVTATKINPGTPSFLIMGSDGLWDFLSNQQAVDLTGKWLKSEAPRGRGGETQDPTAEPFDFGHFKKGVDYRFVENRATIRDDNAAVHLVRNSLGGNHEQLIAGRLALGSPFSRYLRDDTTVQVVFFANRGNV